MQERRNSIANALELDLSYSNPSLCLCSDPPALRQTTWHVDHDWDEKPILQRGGSAMDNGEGLQLVATAAKRVWEELYVCKKPVSKTL